jgi:hypothetical protein
MVTAVVVAAVVFALFFALFLAWPTIWDKITTVTKVTEIDTKSASGDTSRPKTDTKVTVPASGLSSAEIGGIIAGGVVFLVALIFFVVWLRRRQGETPEQKRKKEREKAMAEPATLSRIVTAGKAAKKGASFVGRQAGKVGKFIAKETNAELEKQRKDINKLKADLERIKDKTVKDALELHIEKQIDTYIKNREEWLSRSGKKFTDLEKWVTPAEPTSGSLKGLAPETPEANGEPVGR